MRAYTRRRLIAAAKLGLAAVPFVVAMRAVQGGFLPGGVVLGFGLGFSVGIAELFVMRGWLRHRPFILHVMVKAILILAVLAVAFAVLNVLDVIIDGISWSEYAATLFAADTLAGLLIVFSIIVFLLFFVQLDRLLGPGVLVGYFTGRYHRPRREDRIFMFLDLRDSTVLAERMEPDRYFEFLHRYFSEMSEPILATNAEIYQYVGDEIVLTWRRERGLEEASCVRAFFLIEEQIREHGHLFEQEFGAVPTFRAGLHGGQVIAAQIGELKQDVVYNGDVLNTTSRIQSMCRELGHDLLVSMDLASALPPGDDFVIRDLGDVALRGKAETVRLAAISRRPPPE